MKFCPECGAKLENETVKFCPECGKSISTSEKTEVKKATNPLMEEYEYEGMPDGTYAIIKPKDKYKTKYVIPEGVTVIRSKAFAHDIGHTEHTYILEEVVLPSSLKTIECHAFHGCEKMRKINLPENISIIGEYAFYECHIKASIKIGNIKVCEKAFENTDIELLNFTDKVTNIPDNSFYKSRIRKAIIPSNIKTISKGAFGFSKIGEIVFEEGVQDIHENAFSGVQFVNTVLLPNSIISFDFLKVAKGNYVFNGDVSRIPESVRNKLKFMENGVESRDEEKDNGLSAGLTKPATETNGGLDFKQEKVKVGEITFHLEDFSLKTLKGLESPQKIKILEIPSLGIRKIDLSCLEGMGIETLVLPRDASSTGIGSGEEFLTSLEGNTEIKKVVVPKEVEIFHFALYRNSLGVVSEIEFEDTEGWSISNGGKVKRSIINDPRLMRDFLEKS